MRTGSYLLTLSFLGVFSILITEALFKLFVNTKPNLLDAYATSNGRAEVDIFKNRFEGRCVNQYGIWTWS